MIDIKLRLVMLEKGMKPKELAERAGMSERTLYNIFEGRKCPTLVELELFADILGVYIEDLYTSEKSKYYKENRLKK